MKHIVYEDFRNKEITMKRTKVVDALSCTDFGNDINVRGWVRSHRNSKAVDFIALNDGSTIKNIQVVETHLHKCRHSSKT